MVLQMQTSKLSTRIFILSSIIALIGVLLVAFVISTDYRRNAEARFSELLVANVYNLMGAVELGETGQLQGFPDLGDSRYNLFDSGWYWSIEKVGDATIRLASPSLGGQRISIPDSVPLDKTYQRSFEFTDSQGQDLLGAEAQVILGEGNDLFSFRISANKTVLEKDIASFTGRLAVILSFFALSLLSAFYIMMRFALRPLNDATQSLSSIRAGNAQYIEGDFPDEIRPLIDETNALIKSNNAIVERSRTQVGNLAHSLKTPLAVMKNEVAGQTSSKMKLFQEQLNIVQKQVQVYLERARISARRSTALSRTEVGPTLDKLVNVVAKLNPNTSVTINPALEDFLIFEGEEHDLQEILGNLLENAAKYAASKVRVSAKRDHDHADRILLEVNDNGSGMSQADMKRAQKRGSRIDEGGSGWGLGLSIVRDIIEEYDGKLLLAKSPMGGLSATVSLPGRVDN